MANITLTTGITNNGQFPVDGKTYFLTIADMQDLGNSDANAYIYYENMVAICNEDGRSYKWREEEVSGEEGLIDPPFTYPNGIISNGVDYSNRVFNFFLIEDETTFETSLGTTTIPPNWYEDIVGIQASDLDGLSLTEVIETLFIPTVDASISEQASFSVSGQTTSSQEVGTSISQSFVITLDQGTIVNGDGSTAGDLIGELATVTVNNPDESEGYNDPDASGTVHGVTTSSYILTQGTNTWTSIVTNEVGTTTYADNKGGTGTVESIEEAKAETTRDNVTFSISAYYPLIYGMSDTDDSGGGTSFYSNSDLTHEVSNTGDRSISLLGSNEYIYFGYPSSFGDLSEILDNNGFNVTGSFTKYTADVTSVDMDLDWTEEYNIYRTNSITTVASESYEFNF